MPSPRVSGARNAESDRGIGGNPELPGESGKLRENPGGSGTPSRKRNPEIRRESGRSDKNKLKKQVKKN
eukprot:1183467-Prorocentrum_minimum.AAC.5